MRKTHIVDAESGKLCLTCKKIGNHQGRAYCGRFVTAHDGEYADLEVVRYLRGDACHVAWEPKTAPIISTPNGWLDLETGKIVDVPDRPVQGEAAPGEIGSFAMGLSAGGVVRDEAPEPEKPLWRFVIPEDEEKDIPFDVPSSPDCVLNQARWPEPDIMHAGKTYNLPAELAQGAAWAGGGGGSGTAGMAEIIYGPDGKIVSVELLDGVGGTLTLTPGADPEPEVRNPDGYPAVIVNEPHAETKFVPIDRVWESLALVTSAEFRGNKDFRTAVERMANELERLKVECWKFPEMFEPKGDDE